MLLVIDIGNTNIVIGVFDREALKRHWRIPSSPVEAVAGEYGVLIRDFVASAGIKPEALKGAAVSSVVPDLDGPIRDGLSNHLGIMPRFAGADLKIDMPVLDGGPAYIGADRLVTAYAAYHIFKTELIVVDFGTATTFDYVTKKGEFAGGVIAPGIGISADALHARTAKLPRVRLSMPGRVIGRNTVESMQSGLYFGFAGLTDRIIERMMAEIKSMPRVVATGGLARLVMGESRYVAAADEFLLLAGLRILHEGR